MEGRPDHLFQARGIIPHPKGKKVLWRNPNDSMSQSQAQEEAGMKKLRIRVGRSIRVEADGVSSWVLALAILLAAGVAVGRATGHL